MDKRAFDEYIDSLINKYKFPCQAKITKVYTDEGKYYLDCKELDFNGDETDILFPKVEIPKLWGGEKTAVLCIPSADSIASIGFFNGNIHLPFVINIMGSSFDTEHKENEFIVIFDKTELKIKDKVVSVKIGDDTSFIIEDKKITQGMGASSTVIHDVNGIQLGGSSANEKAVLGDSLKTAFTTLLIALQTHTHDVPQIPSGTTTSAPSSGLASLQNPCDNALSNFAKLK